MGCIYLWGTVSGRESSTSKDLISGQNIYIWDHSYGGCLEIGAVYAVSET